MLAYDFPSFLVFPCYSSAMVLSLHPYHSGLMKHLEGGAMQELKCTFPDP